MKKLGLIILVHGIMVSCSYAQQPGVRLSCLIDFGIKVPFEQSMRGVAVSEDGILAIPLHGPAWESQSPAKVIFLDYLGKKIIENLEVYGSSYYGITPRKGGGFFLYFYGNKEVDWDARFWEYAKEKGLREIEPMSYSELLERGVYRSINTRVGYINQNGVIYSRYHDAWPQDLDLNIELMGKITSLDIEGSYIYRWEVVDRKYLILLDPYGQDDGNVFSTIPYEFLDIKGGLYFKFPFIMAPAGDDDQGVVDETIIKLFNNDSNIMITGHSFTDLMYPEAFDSKSRERRQFVWIYELITEDIQKFERHQKATIITLDRNLSKIVSVKEIDSERYSVRPGTIPVFGLYGRLKENLVLLRDGPGEKFDEIMSLDENIVFDRRFMILKRSATRSFFSGKEDFWYLVTFHVPFGKNEGWIHGSSFEFTEETVIGIKMVQ